MGFFDDDSFEELFSEIFRNKQGSSIRQNQIIQGEEDERIIDFIETEDKIYLVFELPGYRQEDVLIVVKNGKIIIDARKKNGESIQSYLSQKLKQGMHIEKILPGFVKTKKFDFTLKNGILEVIFIKK